MDQIDQNKNVSTNVESEETITSSEGTITSVSESDQNNQSNKSLANVEEIKDEITENINVESNTINNSIEHIEAKEETVNVKDGVDEECDSSVQTADVVDAKEEVVERQVPNQGNVSQDVVDKVETIQIKEEETTKFEVASLTINDQENTETGINEIANTPADHSITAVSLKIDPEIRAHLEKYLSDNGITNYNIITESGSNVGDNFLGVIAKVTIKGKNKNGTDAELKWIVKIAPDIEILRKMIDMHALYKNEATIYETVFPIFKELENEKSIVNGFDSYPQFLFSYMVPLKETIVMQDMKALGYVLRNKKEPLNLDHVKLVMKTYGKFHALSYAFKYSNPDLFESLGAKLKDTFKNAIDLNLVKQTQQAVMDSAKLLLDPVRDSLALKKYSKYADNFMDIYLKACLTTNKYSIICHGDSWINNMLFKYDNAVNPEIPTNICLLDFQVARFASPASDLSYFLFTCTSKAFRDEHYDNMIQLYYYTMCGHLNDLGFNPEKCLSFDTLLAEIKRFSIIGLYMSLLALVAMTTDADETMKSKNQEDYNERIRNIIIEFTQKGYFDFLF